MGSVQRFPVWGVEGVPSDQGQDDPRALIDPRGRRHVVIEILRRRLVAPCDPRDPVVHETWVTAARGTYLLRRREGERSWEVLPL